MNIVVLDGHTLNPGDLDWRGLEALGPCTVYDRTPPAEVAARAADAAAVLTNKTVLDAAAIAALPHLKYIGVLATGYNVVDGAAARQRGIPVTNVPAYGTRSVAQMAMAHVLNLALGVGHHAHTVRQGQWAASPDFCYWTQPLVELAGLTMGIIGFGAIGRAVADLALALGMKVLTADLVQPASLPAGVTWSTVDEIFSAADVVSLHCPLTDETRGLVSAARLSRMKPTAFLINTSRGPLVDEAALAAALRAGRLAGAGLDVLSVEPPPADHPLVGLPNCHITPHIAWATRAARQRLMATAVENLRAFIAGKPQNVVNL